MERCGAKNNKLKYQKSAENVKFVTCKKYRPSKCSDSHPNCSARPITYGTCVIDSCQRHLKIIQLISSFLQEFPYMQ